MGTKAELPRVIILEGPDGAGKTHLAGEIIRRVGPHCRLFHHGPYPGDPSPAVHYYASLRAAQDLPPGGVLILDRAWASEPIYGQAHRGGLDRVGAIRRRMLERVALGLGAVEVICLPPLATCLASFRGRQAAEYLPGETALTTVWHGYQARLAGAPVLPTGTYDRTAYPGGAGGFLDVLAAVRPPANAGPGIGNFTRGAVLLVGEQANSDDPRRADPFVDLGARNGGGCAAWLTAKLEAAGVPENHLYWVNARRVDGTLEDPSFIPRLAPRKIIALGRVAADWLSREAGRAPETFTKVPHPQYWRRFRRHDEYPLRKELQR